MLLLLGVTAVLAYVADRQGLSTDVYLPLIDVRFELGPVYYVLLFFVVAGAANAVNLTDGLDGLAAGTVTIAMLTYTAMMVVAFLSPGGLAPEGAASRIDLAIIGAALVGGCVGFLWYNAYPADVFMGDTGSFGLGGALAAMAVFTKTEVLLVLIGGVFVLEALSVAIQVLWFKLTGKRVFLMAPIHHHFEMLEWTENKIIVRFWIAAAMFGASGFVLYYLAYSKFR
jgi:phospho-N-acetylmuramoyl-pentapeptide-transferase